MEGFRLIGRRPGSVAVWVALWTLVAIGPIIAGVALALPHLIALIAGMRDLNGDGPAMVGKMFEFQAALWSLLGPWMLWLFLAQTVLHAAVFRAVLEPRPSGWAGLKLGMDEVRQFLLQLILAVLWLAYLCVLMALGAAAFWAASQGPRELAGWLDALAVIVLFCMAIYVPVRLSLAGPMTFAKKRVDVFGSWRKTRGRLWPILGMMGLIFIFVMAVSFVSSSLRGLAVLGFDWGQLQSLRDQGGDPRRLIPIVLQALGPGLIIAVLIQGMFEAVMRIVISAPFAAVYRDLSPGLAAAAPAEGEPARA